MYDPTLQEQPHDKSTPRYVQRETEITTSRSVNSVSVLRQQRTMNSESPHQKNSDEFDTFSCLTRSTVVDDDQYRPSLASAGTSDKYF